MTPGYCNCHCCKSHVTQNGPRATRQSTDGYYAAFAASFWFDLDLARGDCHSSLRHPPLKRSLGTSIRFIMMTNKAPQPQPRVAAAGETPAAMATDRQHPALPAPSSNSNSRAVSYDPLPHERVRASAVPFSCNCPCNFTPHLYFTFIPIIFRTYSNRFSKRP